MTDELNFLLDGVEIPFHKGQTIMQAATAAGAYIPHLCFHPDLAPHGSCRLCIVDVNGKTVSSCTQPAEDRQEVHSNIPELQQARLRLIQLLFAEGNHFCPSCEVSGNCQLQALAYDLGMTHYHYAPFSAVRAQDGSHPELFIDRDRCILCDLCGRASCSSDNKNVYALSGRGEQTHLIFRSNSGNLADTAASVNDHAAHICPVGCILPKQGNYMQTIGNRLYDNAPIHKVGNHRMDDSTSANKGHTNE